MLVTKSQCESLFYPNLPPHARIADLGAGSGEFSLYLLDRFSTATIVAIDCDPINIQRHSRLVNAGETPFNQYRVNTLGKGLDQYLCDAVYMVFPEPNVIDVFVNAAIDMVRVGGFILCATESRPAYIEAMQKLQKTGLFTISPFIADRTFFPQAGFFKVFQTTNLACFQAERRAG